MSLGSLDRQNAGGFGSLGPVVSALGPRGGSAKVGGIAIGAVGSGDYAGYTLAWGDDYNGSLASDLIRPGNPYGKFANNFSERDRRRTSVGSVFSDADPYWTGWQDANDGVYVSSFADVLSMADSIITMKTRRATSDEKALLGVRDNTNFPITYVDSGDANGLNSKRPLVAANITMMGQINFTGACILEFKIRVDSPDGLSAADNAQLAAWGLNPRGGSEAGNTATGEYNDENDWIETYYSNQAHTRYASGSDDTGTYGFKTDGTWQIVRAVYSSATMVISSISVDGQTVYGSDSLTYSANNLAQLFYFIVGSIAITSGFDETKWVGKEFATQLDWVRIWLPTGTGILSSYDETPIAHDFGEAFTITLPSQTAMWGQTGVTEDIQFYSGTDTNGPGRKSDLTAPAETRGALPEGVTYNAGTRTLSFSSSFSTYPGVIHGHVFGRKSGYGACRPYRFAVYIRPLISIPQITAPTPGSPYSFQFSRSVRYWTNGNCPHGQHSGLTLQSGPAWLSYDPVTRTLSGDCPSDFVSESLTFRCTNGAGFYSEVTVPFPNTLPAYATWPSAGWFDSSDATTITKDGSNVVSVIANKKAGKGDLTIGGTAGNVTYVSAAQNGKNIVRVARDVTSGTTVSKAVADGTAEVSRAGQGDDQRVTVINVTKPTDTNTGYLWSFSKTTNASIGKGMSVVRRSATASDVRRTAVGSGEQVTQTFGTGNPSGTLMVGATRFSGVAVDQWVNSTTKTLNAVAFDTAAFGSNEQFMLWACQTSGAAVPTYNPASCAQDWCETIVMRGRVPDDWITQAISDLATKWGGTLS